MASVGGEETLLKEWGECSACYKLQGLDCSKVIGVCLQYKHVGLSATCYFSVGWQVLLLSLLRGTGLEVLMMSFDDSSSCGLYTDHRTGYSVRLEIPQIQICKSIWGIVIPTDAGR